jgi:SAM-dependent methyltransferase
MSSEALRTAGAVHRSSRDSELERVTRCPLCASEDLSQFDVRNVNSRDPQRILELTDVLGSDFFVRQSIGICETCDHVFQLDRPSPAALADLYTAFSKTLGKVTASRSNMIEYLLRHNSKDYVTLTSTSIDFLDQHSLLDGVASVLELRTYGGTLLGVLQERGFEHCEGAYIDEFDAQMAREMFGIRRLRAFSFARGFADYAAELEAYDLILAHEALTHSRDPVSVLQWLRAHLRPNGRAVLFREPDTPKYRRYFPLEIVFNNFHLQLFSKKTLAFAIERGGFQNFELFADYHPAFTMPLYVTAVLHEQDGVRANSPREPARRYGRRYYESWVIRDRNRFLRFGERAIGKSRRALRAALSPLGRLKSRAT